MNPTSSNTNKNTGKVLSANSVQWPGPDLKTIETCATDKIPDVIAKLDHVLATILKEIDFSQDDLKCLIPACASCPDPEKTLKSVILLIIGKVCTLEEALNQLGGGTDGEENLIRLASCFQYKDLDGETVLDLPIDQYVKKIGIAFCELKTIVDQNTEDLESLDERLSTVEQSLEEEETGLEVQLQCTYQTNAPKPIKEAVEAFEQKFCQLKAVVGEPGNLTQAVSAQIAEGMGTGAVIKSLSNPGEAIAGWKYTPETIADAVLNMWLALGDIRGAVKAIQDNCCAVTCEDITIDFDLKLSDDRQTLTLFFAHKSILPNGFTDINPLGNKLIITDSAGHTHMAYVKVAEAVADVDGIVIDLSGTALDTSLDFDFDMDANMTNGSMTCSKCIHKTATVKSAVCDYCEISVQGSDGSIDGSVVVIYEI